MAAVIVPTTTDRASRRPTGSARPSFRVIDGGRSSAQLARRRVYRRRRIGALVVVALAVGVVWLAAVGALSVLRGPATAPPLADPSTSAATAAVPPAAAEEYVVVQPGDTLWVIARRLHPEGDVRPVVDELADRAGGPVLQAGQRLDVRGLTG